MDAQYHRWLLTAFNLRNRADYSLLDDTTESAAVLTLEQPRNFLAATRAYLEQHPA